uniref:OCEL domain-containing protein n=1 Tax=Piliocolobus tephrosceles TaxID=591936 RepID=A0A8C9I3W0_9PRIM
GISTGPPFRYRPGVLPLLCRKLCQPQSTSSLLGDPAASSPPGELGRSASPPQKRPQPPDFIDPLANKKPRISHFTQRAQPAINGKLGVPDGREALLPTPGPPASTDTLSSSTHLPPRLEPPRVHDPLSDVSNDLGHSGRDCEHGEVAAPAPTARLGLPLLTDCAQPSRPHSSPSRSKPKKKSKKHKDKERASEDRPRAQPPDCAPATHATLGAPADAPGLNGTCSISSVPTSTSETPDYLLKYAAISSSEQRQSYKNDFNAEYSEYRDLHARIERITRRFTQLDAQLRQLSQGSEEYEVEPPRCLLCPGSGGSQGPFGRIPSPPLAYWPAWWPQSLALPQAALLPRCTPWGNSMVLAWPRGPVVGVLEGSPACQPPLQWGQL